MAERGLEHRYFVFKAKDAGPCGCRSAGCEHVRLFGVAKVPGKRVEDCFVLRPGKDPVARLALQAYAAATENLRLAADLEAWVERIPTTPEELEKAVTVWATLEDDAVDAIESKGYDEVADGRDPTEAEEDARREREDRVYADDDEDGRDEVPDAAGPGRGP